ncbi:MAG: thiosulfate oxidation carrier protein SoxY [Gammaproteobacteria bacterium]|nr:MAG: thiosulfate oxidation carrier protein SoxY [Gammaproteobacteria bacterium]RLA51762.1 MAG: thiosulfate oxidation carrier protein SoxY [Gammaproteobacteria bacterium]
MELNRRQWLRGIFALCGAAMLPSRLFAATPAAFKATDAKAVFQDLFGDLPIEESDAVNLRTPDIAENGAVVPVSVSTDIAGVESISLIVDENPNPLSASFNLTPDAVPDISFRVKMGKSSTVRAMVKTSDKVYMATREVKVTIGGCGG